MSNGGDPLADFWNTPVEAQTALLVSVLRATRSSIADVRRELRWVKRAMWSLVVAIMIAVITTTYNAHHTPVRTPTSTPPSTASQRP